VLCITHLPQVAAPADAHYVVTKQVKDGRTISEIRLLDKKSRITELAECSVAKAMPQGNMRKRYLVN